ncbi:MAG: EF-P beta-lysylation protein EpmB [Pirellulaceae bacterium]|nr:EF-P beta-lysylation protein EpmB [Pirellulaceae bacterium]
MIEKPTTRWQTRLRDAIRDPNELLRLLELSAVAESESSNDSNFGFPLLVTREYAQRMRKGDWNDPLFKQVWIDRQEGFSPPNFVSDPVGDLKVQRAPGLLRKYAGRVLLITTGACAIHCRYCFRRHYPYSSAPRSLSDWQPALQQIEQDTSIREVILSGGDPLTIVDSTLAKLVAEIESIEHIERIRLHTRLPIVLPQRVDDSLLDWLSVTKLSKWIVIHANHAQEIDADVAEAIASLRATGAVLLNQAVLLRGINDTIDVQEQLCKRLLENSVIPYYLNQLDQVVGAAHFEAERSIGKTIVQELAKRLPGYGVPRFVQEIPGQPNKTRID